LPFRPLDDSPPGLFAPWLIRSHTLDDSPPGFIAMRCRLIIYNVMIKNVCCLYVLKTNKRLYDCSLALLNEAST